MNCNKKKIPIGFDRFKIIQDENYYYIDKTELIRELAHSWGAVNLFTRPRRFGKSLNLDMLKTFFEIGSNASYTGCSIELNTLKMVPLTLPAPKLWSRFPRINI